MQFDHQSQIRQLEQTTNCAPREATLWILDMLIWIASLGLIKSIELFKVVPDSPAYVQKCFIF